MKCKQLLAPKHILVGKGKKILKGIRKKRHITYTGIKFRLIPISSNEREKWVLVNLEFYTQCKKKRSRMWAKYRHFQTKLKKLSG